MSDALRDQNRVPTLLGQSNDDATVTIPVKVDPATGRLLVQSTGTIGGGTEYVEGSVDATIAGPALMAEAPSDTLQPLQLDASGNLKVVNSVITGIGHGIKVVAAAGTDEVLAGSTVCKKVTIQAQTDNTGLIAVGAAGVDAAVAAGTGVLLSPGDAFELEADNLSDIYIDSTVTGDGVRYTYFT
jgi:hypothetical protein